MGSGYTYRCSRCGKEYATQLGIGYLFHVFYKDQIDAIRNGLYGPEWQRLFQENDGVALRNRYRLSLNTKEIVTGLLLKRKMDFALSVWMINGIGIGMSS